MAARGAHSNCNAFQAQNSILDIEITQSLSADDETSDSQTWVPAKFLQCCGAIAGQAELTQQEAVVASDSSTDFEDASERLLRSRSNRGSYTKIQHIRQLETWDCGIACLQMVLRWLRESDTEERANLPSSSYLSPMEVMERKLLLTNAETQSVWTVDLVVLLEHLLLDQNHNKQQPNHHNTSYLFCSEVMGVNSSYTGKSYYEKAFSEDSTRVLLRSEEIIKLNLPALCPFHLEFERLLELVSYDHCVAVVLVDSLILMKDEEDDTAGDDAVTCKSDTEYMGHYVIVCGISRDPDHLVAAYSHHEIEDHTGSEGQDDLCCLVVVNPGILPRVMFVSPQRLEQSWRADGTDCDTIFISKHDQL